MAARHFTGTDLVLASHNKGKLREFSGLLAPFGVKVKSAADLGLAVPEETEDTYAGNAKLKALAAVAATGLPALADDSGIDVAALDGKPGVQSARWAPDGDFHAAMGKIWRAVVHKSDHSARFVAVLCLAWPDQHVECFEGSIGGTLTWPPRGENGFGYDSFFVPVGQQMTFAELTNIEKQQISHRARAFRKLVSACFA